MNVTEHAPVPWEYENVETSHDRSAHGVVKDARGRILFDTLNADVAEIHTEYDETSTHRWCEASRQILTLAVAAPALLAACERLANLCANCCPQSASGDEAIAEALAAIKKATT